MRGFAPFPTLFSPQFRLCLAATRMASGICSSGLAKAPQIGEQTHTKVVTEDKVMETPTRPAETRSRFHRLASWEALLTLMLIASSVVNILLAREVFRTRAAVQDLKSSRSFRVGEALPNGIVGKTLSGEPVTVQLAGATRPNLLYVIRVGCSWCTRNAANFAALTKAIERSHTVTILAIDEDVDKVREYVKDTYSGAPTIWNLPASVKSKLGGTPQTLLISAGATVTKNWTGAYSGELLEEIEDYFGVTLPGLTAAPVPVTEKRSGDAVGPDSGEPGAARQGTGGRGALVLGTPGAASTERAAIR